MMQQLLMLIGGLIFSLLGYFLKRTMDELKDVKSIAYENKSQIDLLKLDYKNKIDNLTEKFDELKLTMSELIKEIKELNKRIHGN
jgi:peptidoglycan hydrolase CwlO-like protein